MSATDLDVNMAAASDDASIEQDSSSSSAPSARAKQKSVRGKQKSARGKQKAAATNSAASSSSSASASSAPAPSTDPNVDKQQTEEVSSSTITGRKRKRGERKVLPFQQPRVPMNKKKGQKISKNTRTTSRLLKNKHSSGLDFAAKTGHEMALLVRRAGQPNVEVMICGVGPLSELLYSRPMRDLLARPRVDSAGVNVQLQQAITNAGDKTSAKANEKHEQKILRDDRRAYWHALEREISLSGQV